MYIENFKIALPIMAKGMLSIFIITGVIILTIFVLNKITSRSKK